MLKRICALALALALAVCVICALPASYTPQVAEATEFSYGDAIVDEIKDNLWWFGEDYLNMPVLRQKCDTLKAAGEFGDPAAADFKPVYVAVIDTGLNFAHELFNGLLETQVSGEGISNLGWNTHDDDGNIADESTNKHGTHVAGILAIMIRALGLTDYVKIVPIRASYTAGGSSLVNHDFEPQDVLDAINWAMEQDVAVVNMSLTATSSSSWSGVRDLANDYKNDAVFVAAAGNGDSYGSGYGNALGTNRNSATKGYPAGYSNVLGVMAYEPTESGPAFTAYSNVSSVYDLVAAGGSRTIEEKKIYSAGGGIDDYVWKHGTSMATPMVSMAAALLTLRTRSFPSEINASELTTIMKNHGESVLMNGEDEYKMLDIAVLLDSDFDELLGFSYSLPTSVTLNSTPEVGVSGKIIQWVNKRSEVVFSATIAPTDVNPRLLGNAEWFVDGVYMARGATFAYTPDGAGEFLVTCRVTSGSTTVDSQSIAVLVKYLMIVPENVGIQCDCADGQINVGETVTYTLTGIENYDPNVIVSWYSNGDLISQGKGLTKFAYTPKESGNYNITVVYDDNLLWEEADIKVSKTENDDWIMPVSVTAGVVGAVAVVLVVALLIKRKKLK